MGTDSDPTAGLDALADHLRSYPPLLAKRQIEVVANVLGPGNPIEGPGDDGAVVPPLPAASGSTDTHVIACGEALLPEFVAADPYGAGIAAVLANVNDLAAMGATPLAILNTIVGPPEVAHEALRGMRQASRWYDVNLAGGHLTLHDGAPALSAFGVGRAHAVLSVTHVAAGQALLVAACTTGAMRTDFPFFGSFEHRGSLLASDVRALAEVASSGACVAAKDVSMAGLVGSLAMLLEWSRLGAVLDLDQLPKPSQVSMQEWLTCFPAYAFLLCSPPGREDDCLATFHQRGLDAAVIGVVDDSGRLSLASGGHRATVLDLTAEPVTGLAV